MKDIGGRGTRHRASHACKQNISSINWYQTKVQLGDSLSSIRDGIWDMPITSHIFSSFWTETGASWVECSILSIGWIAGNVKYEQPRMFAYLTLVLDANS